MIAVVTEFLEKQNRRKITVERNKPIAMVRVGCKVSPLKLKKVLKPFGSVLFANGVNTRGITPMDTSEFKEELLFNMFVSYCISRDFKGERVGVLDSYGRYLTRLISVINRVSNTVICTDADADDFCKTCISETGACPDIVSSKSQLYECDTVFSPEGLSGFDGVLFGKGGIALQKDAVLLPDYCAEAVASGVDPADIAAALQYEK